MRSGLGTDKSVRNSLKIELKALRPRRGPFRRRSLGPDREPGPAGPCFTGNRPCFTPPDPGRSRHHADHPGLRPQRGL